MTLLGASLVQVGCGGDDEPGAAAPQATDAGGDGSSTDGPLSDAKSEEAVSKDSGTDGSDASDANTASDASDADAAATDGDSLDANDDGDASPLSCPLGCLPPAPVGWTGPSAVYDGAAGAKPAACPSTTYTQLEVEAHQGMTADDATCDCGTATVEGAYCSASIVGFDGANCTGNAFGFGTAKSTNTGCKTIQDGARQTIRVETPKLTSGVCVYNAATVTLTPPTFAKANMACGLPQVGACSGRPDCTAAPLPDAPFTRVCIHQAGDVACPSTDYGQRFVAYTKVNDGRGCETCAATPTGGACGSMWGLTSDCDGVMAPPTTYSAGQCVPNPGEGAIIDIKAMAPTAISCNQTAGGAPTGQAASEEPVTFCCNK